jgi:NTP pyrophosphatase (non-canonical NTP hydrolase)
VTEKVQVSAAAHEMFTDQLGADVAVMSRLISGSYRADMDPELVDRRRIDKLATEVGEVLEAYNAYIGENPRKGVCGTFDHVLEELLDVAACALAAYEHLTGNEQRSVVNLIGQTHRKRARLEAAMAATDE